ncbi:hypothetical protein ABK040_014580 [Willaertia magna]
MDLLYNNSLNNNQNDLNCQCDVLEVKIIGASNLVPMDRNGFSDPYVIVSYGETQYKTSIIKKSLSPQWNETFTFLLNSTYEPVPALTLPSALPVLAKDNNTSSGSGFDNNTNVTANSPRNSVNSGSVNSPRNSISSNNSGNDLNLPVDLYKNQIYFKVMDQDQFKLKDDFEGDFILPFYNFCNVNGEPYDLPLNNTKSGTLRIATTVKFYKRDFSFHEKLVKFTRKNLLTGSVIYPDFKPVNNNNNNSGTDNSTPRKSLQKQTTKNNFFSGIITSAVGTNSTGSGNGNTGKSSVLDSTVNLKNGNYEPQFKEEKLTENCILLKTDVEDLLNFNLNIIDKIKIELLVGFYNDLNLFILNYLNKNYGNVKIEKINQQSRWGGFKEVNFVIENLNTNLNTNLNNNTNKENNNLKDINGKIFILDIGNNSLITYTYLSNCGQPNLNTFYNITQKSEPPNSKNLFEILYKDIHDTLWLKNPFGWNLITINDQEPMIEYLLQTSININYPNIKDFIHLRKLNISQEFLKQQQNLQQNLQNNLQNNSFLNEMILNDLTKQELQPLLQQETLQQNTKQFPSQFYDIKLLENITTPNQSIYLKNNEETNNNENNKNQQQPMKCFVIQYKDKKDDNIVITCYYVIINTLNEHVWSICYETELPIVKNYLDLFKHMIYHVRTSND